MKSLAVYLKEYKKESILAPLFKLLEVVFDLLVPVVVAQIIDVGVAQDNRSYVGQMFFVLILMAGVGLACSFTAQFFAAKACCGFAAKLRQAIHKLENKTTTFIVSQRIAGIRQADNILVLNNGELVGQGTHNELMGKCQVYREIYFSQFPEERKFYEGGVRV